MLSLWAQTIKNLIPNVMCEAFGSMVRVDDDVVYRDEDDDIDRLK